MIGLRSLHLQSDRRFSETRTSYRAWALMEFSASNLQALTLDFATYVHIDPEPPKVGKELEFTIFDINKFENLHTLSLRGVNLDFQDVLGIFYPLRRLESFSYFNNSEFYCSIGLRVPKVESMIVEEDLEWWTLPPLKLVKTDDVSLSIHFLSFEAEEVYIEWDDIYGSRFKKLKAALRSCQTLREVHLISAEGIGNDKEYRGSRKKLVSLIHSLPKSILRLAIREEFSSEGITLSDKDEKIDIMGAFGHLDNLKQLILPRECKIDEVAQVIVHRIDLSSLDWVYFRHIQSMEMEEEIRDGRCDGKDVTPYRWQVPEEPRICSSSTVIDGIKMTRIHIVNDEICDDKSEDGLVKYSQGMKIQAHIVKLYMPKYH